MNGLDADPMSDIEQEFRDLDRGWVAAYLQGDAELFDRIWIEGFIFTFPFGQCTNKAQEFADLRCGDLAFESLTTDKMKVRVYGKTAVLTCRDHAKWIYHGREFAGYYKTLHVYAERAGRWQLVAVQSCPYT